MRDNLRTHDTCLRARKTSARVKKRRAFRWRSAGCTLIVALFIAAFGTQGQDGLVTDLAVTIENGETYVVPAQNIVYVVAVSNNGPDDAMAASVSVTFGSALTDVVWIAVPAGAASSTQGSGMGNITDTVDIPNGDTLSYAVAAVVDAAAAPGVLSSTATVAPPAGAADPVSRNNSATDEDGIEAAQDVVRNRPLYENTWPSPNAVMQPDVPASDNGAAAFNGHVGDWSAPAPRFVLKTSSFGQPLAPQKASPTSVGDAVSDVYAQLFCLAGASSEQNNNAAFRFINTLYQQQTSKEDGTVGEITRRLDNHLTYNYVVNPDDGVVSDEERAIEATQELIEALQQDPANVELRNLLLDIYYYRALGRQLAAKDKVVQAYEINFSSVVSDDSPFGSPINAEIEAFEAAADALSGVLDPYKELLVNDMGVDITTIDPDYTGHLPFGYYLFVNEEPYRSVYAPTFTGFDEQTGEVSGDPQPVDPGDTSGTPLLYVTRTALNVDENGDSKDPGVPLQFQIRNYGQFALSWQATVTNPTEQQGTGSLMDTLSEGGMAKIRKPGGAWNTTLTDGTNPLAPGGSQTIEIDVTANRKTPLDRTASIEVKDTSGMPDGLTYKITVAQDGTSKPLLQVSPGKILLHHFDFANAITGLFYAERQIYVRNAGLGELNWTATVGMTNCPGLTTFRNPDLYLDLYQSSISGTNAGVVTTIIWLPFVFDVLLIPFDQIDFCGLLQDGFDAGLQFAFDVFYDVFLTKKSDVPHKQAVDEYCSVLQDPVMTWWGDAADNAFFSMVMVSSDDESNPQADSVLISYGDSKMDPPPQKSTSAPLLAAFPQEITVGPGAVQDLLFVRDAADLTDLSVTSSESWIGVTSVNAETGAVELSIAENPSPAIRTGAVEVSASNAVPETLDVTITQGGTSAAGIAVSPSQRFVRHLTGQAEASTEGSPGTGFTVTPVGEGTVAWTAQVTQGQDWLSIVSGESGENPGEVLFAYDTNPGIQGRTGEILIESSDAISGQNRFTVRVTQRGSTGASALTGSYKDLALLFDVLRDDAQVNKELAKRYALRRLNDDIDKAYALIDETVTRHNALLNDIGGLVPGWRESVAPNSELVVTYMGWQQAVEELATVRDFLNGDTNILGLPEDFLFLVQAFQGQPPDLFDSFDKLFEYMFDGENNTAVLTSPLGQAYDKFLTARAQYNNFVVTQDQLSEELRTQNLEHRKWMFDIVGSDPGNDPDNPDDPEAYRDPSGNYGGGIWMIDRSIDRARQGILKNEAEIQRIQNEIQTELWRRSQETQINATIGDLHVAYGNQVATIQGVIGVINGTEECAKLWAEAFNAESVGVGLVAKPLTGIYCLAMETAKGQLEAQKARLAALENCEVGQLQDQILDVNSKALIQNKLGEMGVLGVEAADLALGLITQYADRQANIDEWHYREDRMRENNAALLGRSFANPVHRLRMRQAMLEAEATFKVAQRWVFFAIRALEYKWNTPFAFSSASGNWSMDSLFRARTAKDLIDLMAAIRDFDGLMQGSARFDDRFDWFSFKKGFMGLTPVYDTDGVTELPLCTHPDTGLAATATEVFRARIQRAFDPETGIIELPFSTFRDNGQTFFRGPRRSPSDPTVVLSRGQYLDKIDWVLINLQGDFSGVSQERVSGALTYSGGCYLRNARVGSIPDPSRPDVIVDEFTYWPTKFWFYDSGVPDADPPIPGGWRWSDEQTTEVSLNLVEQLGVQVPDSVAKIQVFRERSVACDGWILRIFTRDLDGSTIITPDQLDDIELQFYHMSKDRPNITKNADDGVETE
jgi:hypothetical protein